MENVKFNNILVISFFAKVRCSVLIGQVEGSFKMVQS